MIRVCKQFDSANMNFLQENLTKIVSVNISVILFSVQFLYQKSKKIFIFFDILYTEKQLKEELKPIGGD